MKLSPQLNLLGFDNKDGLVLYMTDIGKAVLKSEPSSKQSGRGIL